MCVRVNIFSNSVRFILILFRFNAKNYAAIKSTKQNFVQHCISKRNRCNEYISNRLFCFSSSSFLCLWSKIDKLIERHNRTHTHNEFTFRTWITSKQSTTIIILSRRWQVILLLLLWLLCVGVCLLTLIHTFAWDQFIIRIKFPLLRFCSIAHSIIPFVSVLSLLLDYNNHKIEDAHQVWINRQKREKRGLKKWVNCLNQISSSPSKSLFNKCPTTELAQWFPDKMFLALFICWFVFFCGWNLRWQTDFLPLSCSFAQSIWFLLIACKILDRNEFWRKKLLPSLLCRSTSIYGDGINAMTKCFDWYIKTSFVTCENIEKDILRCCVRLFNLLRRNSESTHSKSNEDIGFLSTFVSCSSG